MFDSTEVAWRDMSIFINGQRIGRVRKLKYKTVRELEALHGAGDDAFGINAGNKEHSGEMEVYVSVVDRMNAAARAAGYDDLTDVAWDIVAHYKATPVSPTKTTTLPGCRFSEFEEGLENNAKSMPVNMPFLHLKPKTV